MSSGSGVSVGQTPAGVRNLSTGISLATQLQHNLDGLSNAGRSYRSKGVVFLSGIDQPLLFQYVPGQFSIERPKANTISAAKTQIVFIGIEALDQDNILKQLQSAEIH